MSQRYIVCLNCKTRFDLVDQVEPRKGLDHYHALQAWLTPHDAHRWLLRFDRVPSSRDPFGPSGEQ